MIFSNVRNRPNRVKGIETILKCNKNEEIKVKQIFESRMEVGKIGEDEWWRTMHEWISREWIIIPDTIIY